MHKFGSLYSLISYHEFWCFFFFFVTWFLARSITRKKMFLHGLFSSTQISILVNHTSSLFFTLHISATSKPEAAFFTWQQKESVFLCVRLCVCICLEFFSSSYFSKINHSMSFAFWVPFLSVIIFSSFLCRLNSSAKFTVLVKVEVLNVTSNDSNIYARRNA